MADFTSSGWSVYIMVVTAISLVACFWLTMSLSKGKAPGEEVGTTGHKWDETLEEYNHPLPRWWIYLFYITIIFSIVYLVLYPGFGNYKGSFGWSQISQYEAEVKRADERVAPLFEKYSKMEIQQVAADPDARAMGERGRALKRRMRDAFYCDWPDWRRMIVERGLEMTRRAIAGLGEK